MCVQKHAYQPEPVDVRILIMMYIKRLCHLLIDYERTLIRINEPIKFSLCAHYVAADLCHV